MSKPIKLLPCPFCGYEFTQKEVNENYDCAFVECPYCNAQGPFEIIIDKYPTAAIESWNERFKKKVKDGMDQP